MALSGLKIRLNKCNYVHSRDIQCKHTPYSGVLSKLDKGHQRNMRVCDGNSPFLHSTRAGDVANIWLPCVNT